MTAHNAQHFIAHLVRKIRVPERGRFLYFRGENAMNRKVSSNLYRDFVVDPALKRFGIQTLELLELESARRHLPQGVDDYHLRALLQHYHGKTNAIDFTTDINIALFLPAMADTTNRAASFGSTQITPLATSTIPTSPRSALRLKKAFSFYRNTATFRIANTGLT